MAVTRITAGFDLFAHILEVDRPHHTGPINVRFTTGDGVGVRELRASQRLFEQIREISLSDGDAHMDVSMTYVQNEDGGRFKLSWVDSFICDARPLAAVSVADLMALAAMPHLIWNKEE